MKTKQLSQTDFAVLLIISNRKLLKLLKKEILEVIKMNSKILVIELQICGQNCYKKNAFKVDFFNYYAHNAHG